MSISSDDSHRSHQAGRDARRIAVLNCQLQECLGRLESAHRDLEIIRAGLAHVLRSSLPAAERLAVVMERRQRVAHGSRRAPLRASEEMRRAGRLLTQLLLLGDVDRRRMTIRPVDLTALASTTFERLRLSEPRRGVNVHIVPDILVEADAYLLEVLLTALIEDAWRRVRPRAQAGIHVGWTVMGPDTVCFVRDNGKGLDTRAAERLIGPGGGAGRASRRWSGVGLVLARRIVERHGGRLWVDACAEIGATVYFTVEPAGAAAQGPVRATLG